MLENLLNTKAKKKILSIFLAFPKRSFSVQELHATADVSARIANESARDLVRAEVLNVAAKNRHKFFRVNPRFPLYHELTDIIGGELALKDDLVSKILKKIPNAKLIALSGVFTLHPSSPVDILIVGDNIGRIRLGTILKELEKITGMEIIYAVMPSSEYEYRRMMNDRFVRDILDYPHLLVVNNLKTRRR